MVGQPSRKRSNPLAVAYVLFVIGLGGFTLYRMLPGLMSTNWPTTLAFAVMVFVSEAMPVELPRGGGTVSVSYAISYASILVLGPGPATWLSALATLRLVELSGQVSLKAVLFNRAQLALSVAAAGLTYVAFGGVPGHIEVLHDFWAMLAAAGVCSMVNIMTVVVVMYLTQGGSFWGIVVRDFRWMIPHYLALTPLGVLIGIVECDVGLAGVFLLFVPLVIARYSLQLYSQMRKAYLSTIQGMVAAIEARDPYTAGHSRRVATYTVAAARALRLPEDRIERLEYAAWLHDVGKLAVPDQILRKRGALTAAEWEQMRKHTETGANILKQIRLLGPDVDVILHHHEKWNGEGYPDYMQGSNIPLGARLIAIADAYEAMTSARPYRVRPLTREEAVAELRRGAGTQFDPDLVEVFIKTVDDLPLETEQEEGIVQGRPFRPAAGPAPEEAAYREAAATSEAGDQGLDRAAEGLSPAQGIGEDK